MGQLLSLQNAAHSRAREVFPETRTRGTGGRDRRPVRPGLLTTRGPLIMAVEPYAKMGVLWETFKRHYGPDGSPSVLVAKGSTRDFNATIPQSEIDRELERDRARNTAELLAEFRNDLEGYVSYEVVLSLHRQLLRDGSGPERELLRIHRPIGWQR